MPQTRFSDVFTPDGGCDDFVLCSCRIGVVRVINVAGLRTGSNVSRELVRQAVTKVNGCMHAAKRRGGGAP